MQTVRVQKNTSKLKGRDIMVRKLQRNIRQSVRVIERPYGRQREVML